MFRWASSRPRLRRAQSRYSARAHSFRPRCGWASRGWSAPWSPSPANSPPAVSSHRSTKSASCTSWRKDDMPRDSSRPSAAGNSSRNIALCISDALTSRGRPDARPAEILIRYEKFIKTDRKGEYKSAWTPFLRIHKDYTCAFFRCCSCKPVFAVEYAGGPAKHPLGYLVDASTCSSVRFQIYKESDSALLYIISASKCQCGFSGCSGARLEICGTKSEHTGEIVSPAPQHRGGMAIHMPEGAAEEDKLLILVCCLCIFKRYFEEKRPKMRDEKKVTPSA